MNVADVTTLPPEAVPTESEIGEYEALLGKVSATIDVYNLETEWRDFQTIYCKVQVMVDNLNYSLSYDRFELSKWTSAIWTRIKQSPRDWGLVGRITDACVTRQVDSMTKKSEMDGAILRKEGMVKRYAGLMKMMEARRDALKGLSKLHEINYYSENGLKSTGEE
jgi:hypothetical protein